MQPDRAKTVDRTALEIRSIFSMGDMKIPTKLKVLFKPYPSTAKTANGAEEGRNSTGVEEISAFTKEVLALAKTLRALRY